MLYYIYIDDVDSWFGLWPTSNEGIIYHCQVGSESSENAKLTLWTHLGGDSTGEKTGRRLEACFGWPKGTDILTVFNNNIKLNFNSNGWLNIAEVKLSFVAGKTQGKLWVFSHYILWFVWMFWYNSSAGEK